MEEPARVYVAQHSQLRHARLDHRSPFGGDTPEEIARAVALRTEKGTGSTGRDPGWMHDHYEGLKDQGIHLQPQKWDTAFKNQTGQNINVAANGIAKLLLMIVNDDD